MYTVHEYCITIIGIIDNPTQITVSLLIAVYGSVIDEENICLAMELVTKNNSLKYTYQVVTGISKANTLDFNLKPLSARAVVGF